MKTLTKIGLIGIVVCAMAGVLMIMMACVNIGFDRLPEEIELGKRLISGFGYYRF